MTMQGSQRASEQTLILDGNRYSLIASIDEVVRGLPSGLRRSWSWEPIELQNISVDREFEIALNDFSRGYGLTFSGEDGFYQGPGLNFASVRSRTAWDAGPNGIRTWARVGEWTPNSAESPETTARGFVVEHNGFFYVFKGRFVWKVSTSPIQLTPTYAAYFEVEYADFGVVDNAGNDAIVANRPVVYGGKLYVPLKLAATGAAHNFVVLTTQNTHVAGQVTFAVSGTPTTGTWTIGYQGYTSATIAVGASAATVQAAIQAIPGLGTAIVTISAGSTPNYTYTVDFAAQGGAQDPAAAPDDTMAAFTSPDTFDTGGVTPSVVVAAVTDLWDAGRGYGGSFGNPSTDIKAIAFAVFHHPINGPTLARAEGNLVYLNAGTPLTYADWGSGYEVGDSGVDIANLFTYGDDLLVWKEDGTMWLFDAQGVAKQIPDVRGVGAAGESVNATTWFGRQYIPTANGLIEWRPGASRTIGPEQDRLHESERSPGVGRIKGMARHGDRLYYVGWDEFRGEGFLASFTPTPRSDRMPLTPHLHSLYPWLVEDLIVSRELHPGAPVRKFSTFSSDSAVGTVAWTTPGDAEDSDDAYAEADGAGTTEYLKALNLTGASIPVDADIVGVEIRFEREKVADSEIELVGAGAEVEVSGASSITLSTHGDVAADDFLLAAVSSSQSRSTPSGWTHLFDMGSTSWYWRLSPGGAASYTFSVAASAIALSGQITAYRNVDTVDPIGVTGSEITGAGSASLSVPSAATVGQNELALVLHAGVGGALFTANAPSPDAWENGLGTNQRSGFTYMASAYGRVVGTPTTLSGITVTTTAAPSVSHAARILTLNPNTTSNIVDDTVKLVVGGSVVGSDLSAGAQWADYSETKAFGGPTSLWGLTPTAAQINATDFGVVLSAVITSGTARVDQVTARIFYELDGSEEISELLVVMGTNEDDNATSGLQFYRLPRHGLTPLEDEAVAHGSPFNSTMETYFATARYRAPGFEIEKVYRAVEMYVEVESPQDGSEIQVWAAIDDGTRFQLLDGATPAAVRTSGSYRFFFPRENAVGSHVQLFFIPRTDSSSYESGFHIYPGVKIRGAYRAESGRLHTYVVRLDEGARFADGMERRTVRQQIAALEALRDPGAGSGAPVDMRRPDGVETHGEVISVQAQEVDFKGQNASVRPGWIAVVRVREMPYE